MHNDTNGCNQRKFGYKSTKIKRISVATPEQKLLGTKTWRAERPLLQKNTGDSGDAARIKRSCQKKRKARN
jgi:hypothetical protein